MKQMQVFSHRGVTFQYVEGCGLAILEEDGNHAEIESMEESVIRKEALRLIAAGDFSEFEFEPQEPVLEEGGDVEIPTEEPQEEIDDTVVAVSYTDCYGQPQLAETNITLEERAEIEANMVGRHGNHGQEITWAILSTINRQANNTCWQYHFETNTGTVFV
jgi:hypothetical protein